MQITKIIFSISALFVCLSCRKSAAITAPVSINIVHAMADGNPVVPLFGPYTPAWYGTAQSISYQGSQLYSPLSSLNELSVVQISDTGKVIYKGSLDVTAGGIYSFFLAGDTTRPDTVFVQDHISTYDDSSAGARFINLSPGSQPISINLAGNPLAQMEFNKLGYKQISSFVKYPANSTIPGNYTFEIRDQVTGNLLTSFSWYYTLFKNNTLVVSGSEDPASTTPLAVFQVNNF